MSQDLGLNSGSATSYLSDYREIVSCPPRASESVSMKEAATVPLWLMGGSVGAQDSVQFPGIPRAGEHGCHPCRAGITGHWHILREQGRGKSLYREAMVFPFGIWVNS